MAISLEAFFAKVGYAPHSAGQHSYHYSDARFRIPVCGRRYGKSKMAGTDLEPKLFAPDKRFWIVGPTYDLGEKEFRVIWNDLIVGQAMGRDKRVKKAYSKRSGDLYIEFPWQTRLEVRSADHPENLVGEALDGVIMSEAAKHKKETWERYIRPSLSDKRGFADFPTTPEGFNWLHELWQFGQNPDFPEYASWQFASWDNPFVYPGGKDDPEIALLRRTVTPEYFAQEIAAEFSAFVGKIFPEWREAIHVKQHTFRPDWPNYMCFDWGYTNPLAAVEFQVAPDDTVYVWREHYLAYTTLQRHVEMMKTRVQPAGYHLDLAFGDAADPMAAQHISETMVPCIVDPEAKTNWRQGIDLIRRHMTERETGIEIDEYGTPHTRPWLYVDHSCTNLIAELNNYRAKQSPTGTNVPEMGQKMQDHAIDALRYGFMHLFELGANHHLTDVYEPSALNVRGMTDSGYFTMGGDF